MTDEDRKARKAILHAVRDAERKAAESELPAAKPYLLALFEYVDDRLAEGCDHTLKYTLEFASTRGLERDSLVQWLQKYGGYCDCEVVANVQDTCPAFRV